MRNTARGKAAIGRTGSLASILLLMTGNAAAMANGFNPMPVPINTQVMTHPQQFYHQPTIVPLAHSLPLTHSNKLPTVTEQAIQQSVQLDLSSSSANIHLNTQDLGNSQSVVIKVGGVAEAFKAGTMVTAAEYVAIQQHLTGAQTLTVDSKGSASAGSFSLSSLTKQMMGEGLSLNELTIPQGITATDNFAKSSAINISGAIIDDGNLLGLSTSSHVLSGSLSAQNIVIAQGATLSTVAPSSITGHGQSGIGLQINAVDSITNSGTLSSSGALSLNTGAAINNTGKIESLYGDINIGSASSAASINVNGTGGTFSALHGNINVRDAAYSGSGDINLNGGNYLSKNLNLYAGSGAITGNVGQVSGNLNTSGDAAHFLASTPTLNLGTNAISGDPTYANASGDIVINGAVTAGENLTIVAAGNIIGKGDAFLSTANASGASAIPSTNITLVAGADVTTSGASTSVIPGTSIGSGNTATVDFSSGKGGNIDLSNSIHSGTIIDASSNLSPGGNNQVNGGSVTLAAYANGTSGGQIYLPSGAGKSIDTSSANGSGGAVAMIAGSNPASAGTTIKVDGSIVTSGGPTGQSGTVALYTQQPDASSGGNHQVTFDATGTQISGASITNSGAISSNAQVFTGDIITSGIGGASAGNITIQAGAGINTGNLFAAGGNATVNATTFTPGGNITTQAVTAPGGIILNSIGNITTSDLATYQVTAPQSAVTSGQVSLTATGSITTGNIDASGTATALNANVGPYIPGVTGSSAGAVTLVAGADVQTGYIRAFGAGGSGSTPFATAGNGGNGGAVFVMAGGIVSINGDINTSGGGGGGGGYIGAAGAGGNAGTISVTAGGTLTVTGPVLAAGGGGGQGTSEGTVRRGGGASFGGGGGGGDSGSGGGGLFGGGGSENYTSSQGGGALGGGQITTLNDGADKITAGSVGLGGNGESVEGNPIGTIYVGGVFGISGISGDGTNTQTGIAQAGYGNTAGAGGASAFVSLTGSTVSAVGTVTSQYSSMSSVSPNPFSSSPYANVGIYGSHVNISATNGSVTTAAVTADGAKGVNITADNGNIVSGDITTSNSNQAAGNIYLQATGKISAGQVAAAGLGSAQAGTITIIAGGNVIATSLDASSQNSNGGTITIAGANLALTGGVAGGPNSISAAAANGSAGSVSITLSSSQPFIIGAGSGSGNGIEGQIDLGSISGGKVAISAGSIVLNESISAINVDGSISLTCTTGGIAQNNGVLDTPSLSLFTNNSDIGSAASSIDTTASNLTASTTVPYGTGSVYITDSNAVGVVLAGANLSGNNNGTFFLNATGATGNITTAPGGTLASGFAVLVSQNGDIGQAPTAGDWSNALQTTGQGTTRTFYAPNGNVYFASFQGTNFADNIINGVRYSNLAKGNYFANDVSYMTSGFATGGGVITADNVVLSVGNVLTGIPGTGPIPVNLVGPDQTLTVSAAGTGLITVQSNVNLISQIGLQNYGGNSYTLYTSANANINVAGNITSPNLTLNASGGITQTNPSYQVTTTPGGVITLWSQTGNGSGDIGANGSRIMIGSTTGDNFIFGAQTQGNVYVQSANSFTFGTGNAGAGPTNSFDVQTAPGSNASITSQGVQLGGTVRLAADGTGAIINGGGTINANWVQLISGAGDVGSASAPITINSTYLTASAGGSSYVNSVGTGNLNLIISDSNTNGAGNIFFISQPNAGSVLTNINVRIYAPNVVIAAANGNIGDLSDYLFLNGGNNVTLSAPDGSVYVQTGIASAPVNFQDATINGTTYTNLAGNTVSGTFVAAIDRDITTSPGSSITGRYLQLQSFGGGNINAQISSSANGGVVAYALNGSVDLFSNTDINLQGPGPFGYLNAAGAADGHFNLTTTGNITQGGFGSGSITADGSIALQGATIAINQSETLNTNGSSGSISLTATAGDITAATKSQLNGFSLSLVSTAGSIGSSGASITSNAGTVIAAAAGSVYVNDTSVNPVVLVGASQAGASSTFYLNTFAGMVTASGASISAGTIVLNAQNGNIGAIPSSKSDWSNALQINSPGVTNLTASAQTGSVYVQSQNGINFQESFGLHNWTETDFYTRVLNGDITDLSSANIAPSLHLLLVSPGNIGTYATPIVTNTSGNYLTANAGGSVNIIGLSSSALGTIDGYSNQSGGSYTFSAETIGTQGGGLGSIQAGTNLVLDASKASVGVVFVRSGDTLTAGNSISITSGTAGSVPLSAGSALSAPSISVETPAFSNGGSVTSNVLSVDNANGNLFVAGVGDNWHVSTGIMLTATGNVDFGGLFQNAGDTLHIDGTNFLVVAGGNISSSVPGTIETNGVVAGSQSYISGASYGLAQGDPSTNTPTTVTINGASVTGGAIDFASSGRMAFTSGLGKGGDQTFIAYAGTAPGTGTVTFDPNSISVSSRSVLVIAGANSGTAITIANVTSDNGSTGLYAATPQGNPAFSNGLYPSGGFTNGAAQGGAIAQSAGSFLSTPTLTLSTNGSNIGSSGTPINTNASAITATTNVVAGFGSVYITDTNNSGVALAGANIAGFGGGTFFLNETGSKGNITTAPGGTVSGSETVLSSMNGSIGQAPVAGDWSQALQADNQGTSRTLSAPNGNVYLNSTQSTNFVDVTINGVTYTNEAKGDFLVQDAGPLTQGFFYGGGTISANNILLKAGGNITQVLDGTGAFNVNLVGANQTLTVNAAGGATISVLSAAQLISQVDINNSAGGNYTLTSNGSLGVLANLTSPTVSLAAPSITVGKGITVGATSSLALTTGTLTLSGSLNADSGIVTINSQSGEAIVVGGSSTPANTLTVTSAMLGSITAGVLSIGNASNNNFLTVGGSITVPSGTPGLTAGVFDLALSAGQTYIGLPYTISTSSGRHVTIYGGTAVETGSVTGGQAISVSSGGAVTVEGNLTASTKISVSALGSGSIIIDKGETVAAPAIVLQTGSITSSGTINAGTGNVFIFSNNGQSITVGGTTAPSGNLLLNNTLLGAIEAGTLNVGGSSNNSSLTVGATLNVSGTPGTTAGSYNLVLGSAGTFSSTGTTITEGTQTTTVGALGNVDVGTIKGTGTVTIGSGIGASTTVNGSIAITGTAPVTIASGGALTTSGNITSQTIVLSSGSNGNIVIGGNVGVTGGATTLIASGTGSITDSGTPNVIGSTVTLTSGSGNIGSGSLDTQAANLVVNTTGAVSINNNAYSSPTTLQANNIGGSLTLTSGNAITVTSAITAPNISITAGTNSNILLTNTLGTAGGTVSLTTKGTGNIDVSSSGIVLGNAINLTIATGAIGSKTPFLVATNNLAVNSNSSGAAVIDNTASNGNLNLGPSSSGALTVTSGGPITTTGTVTGSVISLTAGATGGITIGGTLGSNSSAVSLTAGAGGSIAGTGTYAINGAAVTLASNGGNIGSGTVLSVNTTSLSANTSGSGLVNLNNTNGGILTVNNSTSGGGFQLVTAGQVAVNNIQTGNGSISVDAGSGTLNVAANANIHANNGSITIEQDNTGSGKIVIGAGVTLYGSSTTAGVGNVNIVIGAVPTSPMVGTPPGNVAINQTGGGEVFFGAKGITTSSPVSVLNAFGRNIVFNTGSRPASAITLSGNDSITADPPEPVAVSSILSGTSTASLLQSSPSFQNRLLSNMPIAGGQNASSTVGTQGQAALQTSRLSDSQILPDSEPQQTSLAQASVFTLQSNVNLLSAPSRFETLSNSIAPPMMQDSAQQSFAGSEISARLESDADLEYALAGACSPTSISPETNQIASGTITLKRDANNAKLSGVVSVNHKQAQVKRLTHLKNDNALFAPSIDTVVETKFGMVEIAAHSLVLVMAKDDSLSIYDLDDSHKNSVTVKVGTRMHALAPGKHVLITDGDVSQFDQINPAECIAYRSISAHSLDNGMKAFVSEFSVQSAMWSVKPLRALVLSKHEQAARLSNHLIKTTAIMYALTGTTQPYQQVLRRRMTAMR